MKLPQIFEENLSLVGEVFRQAGIKVALLFGSTARGCDRPDSDLDMAVYWAGKPPEADGRVELEKRLMGVLGTGRVHLVFLNGADPVLKREVFQDGLVLYQSDEEVYDGLYLLALKEYEDTARFRRYQIEYLSDRLEGASSG